MSDDTLKVREGRVFIQQLEFVPFDLAQCQGLSDWNKPRGAVSPIREQSLERIGEEEVVGAARASKDMATFTLQARFKELQNYLFSLKCAVNAQVLLKHCGDPTDYYGFKYGLAWNRSYPGDLSGDPLAIIEGDNVPIGMNNPMSAIWGPYLVDYGVKFLSPRNIAEYAAIMDIIVFGEECLEDCQTQEGNGQNGYVVTDAYAGSPTDVADIWYFTDYGDTLTMVSTFPFPAGVDISSIVKKGTIDSHRVIVAAGTAQAGYAQIAYADVTSIGQTDWVLVDVGTVAGQYITQLAWPTYHIMFAITNDGYIYRSRDGGVTWALEYQTAIATLLSEIVTTKRGVVVVVGDDDLVLISEDYGENFTEVDGPTDGVADLLSVALKPNESIVLGADDGNFYGSYDFGDTWTGALPAQGITATQIDCVRFYHNDWGWALALLADGSSRVLRSTDGGATWRLWDLAQNIVPNNGLNIVTPVDQNRCLVGGEPLDGTAFFSRTTTNVDRLI